MSDVFKGTLRIKDREFECEVRDGVRYVDGMPVDQFLFRLTPDELHAFSHLSSLPRSAPKQKTLDCLLGDAPGS